MTGRTVDEIRADLADPMVANLLRGGELGSGPVQRLLQDLARVVDGAADQPADPDARTTAAERWRRLLETEHNKRSELLERMYEAALHGTDCLAENHRAVIDDLQVRLRGGH